MAALFSIGRTIKPGTMINIFNFSIGPEYRIQSIMPIDNLPSLLPIESSEDYAAQLLTLLRTLVDLGGGALARAKAVLDAHVLAA